MKVYNNIEQGSDEWHQQRKGKLTGTVLKNIMGTPKARQEAIYEMIADRLTVGIESETSFENAMDRGTRLEPDAITMFEFETGLKVDRTGFCEDETNPLIANSPDGLIGEDEAIEVKCLGGKNHVKMWLTNEIPDDYKWQVIQYFVVNPNLKKLYFVGYHPDIAVHPLHIIEVPRDEQTIKVCKDKEEVFLKEVELELSKIIKL